jgi:hypothetical protein
MRRLLVPAAAACVLLGAAPAFADRPPAGGGKAPRFNADKSDWEWYGWQTLLVDAVVVPGVIIGAAVESEALLYASLGTFLVAPPIVHGANGNWLEGWASFGVRFAAPFLAMGGIAAACRERSDECLQSMGAGITAGMIAASTFDAAILTWKPLPNVTVSGASVRLATSF